MKINNSKLTIVMLLSIMIITQTVAAVTVEEVSAPYEVIGAINATGAPYISVNPTTNPSIFYYDIEDGNGGENLYFPFYPNLTIPEGEFNYTTTSWMDPDTMDMCVAWLGEKYLVIQSSTSKWIITKKLVDEDDNDDHMLRVGESLSLPDGYAITALEIDVDGNEAWFSFTKDGEEIDNRVVNSDPTFGNNHYVYQTDLGASYDVEVLNFTLDTVFSGMNTNLVVIKNIDFLSPESVELYNGDQNLYENFIIKTFSWEIKIENDLDIVLQPDSANPIMGGSYSILVNKDEDSAALVKVFTEPGTYEIIGATNLFTGNYISANATGKPSILYYDIDEKVGGESLDIFVGSNLMISSGNLTYFTSKWQTPDGVEFIGMGGKKHIVLENNATVWKIAEKLIDNDEDDFHTLKIGESQSLGEGFILTVQEIDVNGSQVCFTLDKDGLEVDNEAVSVGSNFIYSADLGTSNFTEVLNFTVESVYFGVNTRFVKINNTDLISTNVLEIQNGDTALYTDYVITTNESRFVITNNNNIVLTSGGVTDIIDGLFSIRVSEDEDIIAVLKTINIPEDSIISIPDCQAAVGDSVTIPIYIDVAEPDGLGEVIVNLTYDPSIVEVITASSSDFDSISADIVNPEGYVIITANQGGSTGVGPGKIKLADITLQTVGKYGGGISPLDLDVITLQNIHGVKVPYTAINGTFEKVTTGIIENVPIPYEVMGVINYSGVSSINATSLFNPSILFYDLNGQAGDEMICLLLDPGLTIGQSNLTYITNYWVSPDTPSESYIAWLGEKHNIIDRSVSKWIITKKLVDEGMGDNHLFRVGESLTLPEGWAITALEVNVDGTKAWFLLTKDGVEIADMIVNSDPTFGNNHFVYETDLGATGDTEVLNFTLETVYAGMNTNLVLISNIDLISTDKLELSNGDSTIINGYTIYTDLSGIGIDNDNTISLTKDSTNDIFGGHFSLKVNDDGNSVGLVKTLTEPGLYEIMGLIGATGTSLSATSENCPSILYYDFEARAGGESLVLPVYANLTIPANELMYSTSYWSDSETGLIYAGWQGKKYLVITKSTGWWNITEKLVDEDESDTHLLSVGENLTFDEGFVLTLLEADFDGQEAWLSLSKDGIEINNSVVSNGSNYVYEIDLGAADNTEVLNLTVESVFAGMNNTSLVKINNIDLISTEVLELQNNDMGMFNGYKVTTTTSQVSITNIDDVYLSEDSITYIIDGLFSIRVDEMGSQAALVKSIQTGVLPSGGSGGGGGGSDTEAPTIQITSPCDGYSTTLTSITINGTASDNINISKVDVRVGSGTWINSTGTTNWSASVDLIEGTNIITARATDTSGNTNSTLISVIRITLTSITISDYEVEAGGNITVPISIEVADSTGLGAASINLNFNASVVNVIAADSSDFDSFTPNINNSTGEVWMVAYQTGATGVGPGTIKFANITLQAMGNRTEISPLNLEVVTLKNNTGISVPYQVLNGTFEIGLSGDFSGDDVVDSWDCTYLARHLVGLSGYEGAIIVDISGDGEVDAWDITYLARALAGIPGYGV